jgi:hypothetical protein
LCRRRQREKNGNDYDQLFGHKQGLFL